MLSQGWDLLHGMNVELPRMLRPCALRRHVTDSLWTLFDPRGVALVRDALDAGEIR